MNAILIDEKDNVAVAIEPIVKGDIVEYMGRKAESFAAKEDITIYHKLAVRDIRKGEQIVKYGEHIGIASTDIEKGQLVHTHNVEDHRENLEHPELPLK